jgi:colicin import membrane protein
MKKIVLAMLMALGSLPLWAQSNAATGNADFEAERSRLAAERAAIEARFDKERAACYQKFAVEDCLRDSRKRRRAETDHIKRQESAINDIERQRRGAAELEKLDQKAATRRPQDTPEKQEEARKGQQDREQRAADHAASRAATAAEADERRRQFEAKQKAQADEQAKAAQRRAEAPAAVERFESKQQKAAEHRASRERQNAERTKPRGAPLPTPPASPASAPSR